MLAGRFRIVAALGKGGMGEVWRADDLSLGQPVALKFLPPHLADDPDRLARFRKEVAVARRVSHPNCCRVYDIGEQAGQVFLSMEYIDGESLDALLRRLGRLPEEKAVEVARQLCQALAAVHDQGLLHRDLKPANVMLDARGNVRLTDFGLAAAAEDLSATEVRSGTPLYQAPEQIAGKEVTVRSDLFALGLVLYELFTGKRAFPDAKRDTPPSKPSSHVSGMSPAVEQLLLKCLEAQPANRPRSAIEALLALPGGDPLAAVLAAGETPSPQLVADAGGEGTIRPWVGLVLLGVVVINIVLIALAADRVMLFRKVPLPEPPAVLARRAQQILERLGYPDRPAGSAYYFRVNGEALLHTARTDQSPDRWDRLATDGPPPLYFFYRQSPRLLAPNALGAGEALLIRDDNPAPTLPGMAGVHLGPRGQLLRMYAVPPRRSEAPPTPDDVDWARWFDRETIGFDLWGLSPATPVWAPPCACDRQAAWTGALPERPDLVVRVEAAAYRGRPVYFEVIPAAREAEPADVTSAGVIVLALGLLAVAAGAPLAIRNLRRGRGDVRGALRLGLCVLAVVEAAWLVGGHHTASPGQIAIQQALVLGYGGLLGLLYGVCYLALEPAVRRRWPWRITAWNRLLAGRLRDPMVGRDLLVGLALGTVQLVIGRAAWLSHEWAGLPPPPPFTGYGPNSLGVAGPPTPLYLLLSYLIVPIVLPVLFLLLSFLFFLILRREWLAWGAVFLFFFLPVFSAGRLLAHSPAGAALVLVWIGLALGVSIFAVARFGLLALAGIHLCDVILSLVPLTADLSAWYANQGVIGALVVIGLAGCGLVTATRGQWQFGKGFFGDE